MDTNRQNQLAAYQITALGIIVNIVLTIFKLIAGILGHSAAMVSDAVHSLSDVFSSIVVLISLKMAGKKPDICHPYGHERFECVAAILLAGVLLITGLGIGWVGIAKILAGDYAALPTPGVLALIAAIVSILVKEAMFWATLLVAKRVDSSVLIADAWHHRSDALSSVGSLIGVAGARLGWPILDPLASIVICLFILKAAYDIFRDAVGKMTDRACDAEFEAEIAKLVLRQPDVLAIDILRTRRFGDRIYVDVEIAVDGSASLKEAHLVAHQVHDAIEGQFGKVKHCMVHVNPAG